MEDETSSLFERSDALPEPAPRAKEIRYLEDQDALRVTFADGHQSNFPTTYLRGFCPCATCQGHSRQEPAWVEPVSHDQIELADISSVGPDAVRLHWADGHSALCSFRFLRNMCPCAVCKPERLPETQRRFAG